MAESYQYVKEFWIILLLTYIFVKKRNLLFLVFSLVFVYIFADDVMMIHEKLGTNLQTYIYYPQMFGLREQDLGELTVYAFFGLIFFIILAFAYYRASDELRMIGLKLFLLLFAFALFGGGVDIGDSIFRDYEQLTRVMRVLEDGGELIVMSFMCWYVFKTSNRMDEERILSS